MITKRRPKAKRPEMFVYFMDEAPAIGCGWRGIKVEKRGRKWVRVRAVATGIPAKLPKDVFAQMERRAR